MKFRTLPLPLIAFLATSPADAATITWLLPTDITASTDVSTLGTLVEAYFPSTEADTKTVNTVTFLPTGNFGTEYNTGLSVPTANNDYNDLFFRRAESANTNALYVGEGDGNLTNNTGGNLVPNRTYLIQVWFNSNDSTHTNRVGSVGSTTQVTLADEQYVIGTFVADGSEQYLFWDTRRPDGDVGQDRMPAYQIRDITPVPEPSAALLGSLGILMLLRRRR